MDAIEQLKHTLEVLPPSTWDAFSQLEMGEHQVHEGIGKLLRDLAVGLQADNDYTAQAILLEVFDHLAAGQYGYPPAHFTLAGVEGSKVGTEEENWSACFHLTVVLRDGGESAGQIAGSYRTRLGAMAVGCINAIVRSLQLLKLTPPGYTGGPVVALHTKATPRSLCVNALKMFDRFTGATGFLAIHFTEPVERKDGKFCSVRVEGLTKDSQRLGWELNAWESGTQEVPDE